MRITTVINGKGGVAKTTTAHALAAGLYKGGFRPLAIDYDRQGNLSLAFGADNKNEPTMYHVISGEATLAEAIQETPQGFIIAGNSSLGKLDTLFAGAGFLKGVKQLRQKLEGLSGFSHVIIDNAPNIAGLQALQSLAAATDIVIPMTTEVFSAQGVTDFQEAYESVREDLNPGLAVAGVLLVRHNPRTQISGKIGGDLRVWAEQNGIHIYNTTIREGVSVKESQLLRQSLFDYAPTSNPALDYLSFLKEYVAQGE